MTELIQKIKRWIAQHKEPVMIGISGHGAAGKTTFAQNLIQQLADEVNFLNTDPYMIGSRMRQFAEIDYTYDGVSYRSKMTACHPAAHHIASLERDICMLKKGMDVCTIDTHYSPTEVLRGECKVSIVEGMAVAFSNPALFDLLIYFYTDGDTEFERRAVRDVNERGMDIHYLKQSHDDRRRQYEVFMHPYHEHFDVVVKSGSEGINRIENNFFV